MVIDIIVISPQLSRLFPSMIDIVHTLCKKQEEENERVLIVMSVTKDEARFFQYRPYETNTYLRSKIVGI